VTRVIGREVERANGVLVSPDDRYLYVADNNNDTRGGRQTSLAAADTTLRQELPYLVTMSRGKGTMLPM
jgi:hypothetical protein